MNKKISKPEIVMALKICTRSGKCTGCPAKNIDVDCIENVMKGALEIIKNQSKTIGRLKSIKG